MRLCCIAITTALLAMTTASDPAKARPSSIVTGAKYRKMFPLHITFYSYDAFARGGAVTKGFCTTGDTSDRIRECAGFLANFAHETGGARLVAESGRKQCPDYCDAAQTGACAPAKGQTYFGRGWLQLSWNYNYCEASKYIFGDDGNTLVQHPDILEKDATVSLQASLWFWMTQKGAGTMSAHDCIVSGEGFGCTIRSINGTLECDDGNLSQVKSRISSYLKFLDILSDGTVEPMGRNEC